MTRIDGSITPETISNMAGRYVVGHQTFSADASVFACRLRSISAHELVITGPIVGAVGADIATSFRPFGTIRGVVSRHLADAFVIEIVATDTRRADLARRLSLFRDSIWTGSDEKRSTRRYMPAEPRSIILRADGTVQPCLVINYAIDSAAVSAENIPAVGDRVTIGQVPAHVVRLFDVGFAVRFDEALPAEEVEQLLEAPLEWQDAVAIRKCERIDTSEPGDTAEGYGYD